MTVNTLRRQAFALATELVGKGDPAHDLLCDIAQVDSLAGLSGGAWRELVETLQAKVRAAEHVGCTRPQWQLIKRLQRSLKWNDTELRGFFKHVAKIEHERFLTPQSARAIIAGLNGVIKKGKGTRRSAQWATSA